MTTSGGVLGGIAGSVGVTPTVADLIKIARLFLYVREAQSIGQNRGLRVEGIQRWSGGHDGDSWCAEIVWLWLDITFRGHPPFDRMQSCESIRAWAQDQGRIVAEPRAGDLVLHLNSAGRAHHIGLVTVAAAIDRYRKLVSIAGNTSEDGSSANGDRVAEHEIASTGKLFVRLPLI